MASGCLNHSSAMTTARAPCVDLLTCMHTDPLTYTDQLHMSTQRTSLGNTSCFFFPAVRKPRQQLGAGGELRVFRGRGCSGELQPGRLRSLGDRPADLPGREARLAACRSLTEGGPCVPWP